MEQSTLLLQIFVETFTETAEMDIRIFVFISVVSEFLPDMFHCILVKNVFIFKGEKKLCIRVIPWNWQAEH